MAEAIKFTNDKYLDSSSVVYNKEIISPYLAKIDKICKKLWDGYFTSGSINVPNTSDYTTFIVKVGSIYCFGNRYYGVGGFGEYGSYAYKIYSYRFSGTSETWTITDTAKGGSDGTENIEVTEIYGLF